MSIKGIGRKQIGQLHCLKDYLERCQDIKETNLTFREFTALKLRLSEERTLTEIGGRLGCSRSRAEQLCKKALFKMQYLKMRLLWDSEYKQHVREGEEKKQITKQIALKRLRNFGGDSLRIIDLYNEGLLSTRVASALLRGGKESLEDLRKASDGELLNIRNFGEKALREVRELLNLLEGG